MTAYYNEHDPFAAAWLRELIKDGLIAAGDVDERSIEDVSPDDVRAYTQVHWFAGIGGWSYALRLAGWRDEWPVWTGSAPCQPFSSAGKGEGFADERHLWPALFWHIRHCQPATFFGEQVSQKKGMAWLDVVASDLENAGYGVGAFDLCAAGAGAPHIRQRLYFVASSLGEDAKRYGWGGRGDGDTGGNVGQVQTAGYYSSGGGLSDDDGGRFQECNKGFRGVCEFSADSSFDFWGDVEWLPCIDGKCRPAKPGIFPLAYGIPNRVGSLRGAGNAIVPQVAARFIDAYMDYIGVG